MRRSIILLACLCIVGTAGLVVVLNKRSKAPDLACRANLKQIDSATASWAIENKMGPDDSPSKTQIFGDTLYIKVEPKCPKGGFYTLGSISKAPTCSHPGHQILINPEVAKAGIPGKKRYLDE
jgi:hypothetical protein